MLHDGDEMEVDASDPLRQPTEVDHAVVRADVVMETADAHEGPHVRCAQSRSENGCVAGRAGVCSC